MSVVVLLWRTHLRSSWRSAVVLVALIGLGGSVALAVGAGARRTASAAEVIARWTNAADLAADIGPDDPARVEQAVRSIDGVADHDLVLGFQPVPADGRRSFLTLIGAWQDPVAVNRPVMLRGRPPTGPGEAMVNEHAAEVLGLAPGDHIELHLPDPTFTDIKAVAFDIVGVGLTVDEVVEDELSAASIVFAPRAFTERHLDRAIWGNVSVVLSPGADVAAVRTALHERELFVDAALAEDRKRTQDALRPLVVALAGFSALAATATVLVTVQALNLLLRRRRRAERSLRAMGCDTRQLVLADVAYAATVVAGGVALAVAVAVTASPLFPVGPVRRADVVRGVDVDLTALGGGAALLAAAVLLAIGLGSWRRSRAGRPVTPGRVPALLASRAASATGLRLATASRGSWRTVAGVAAGLAVMVAALTFTGSVGRLLDDPSLVGLTWDVGGRTPFDSIDREQVRRAVQDDPGVERATGVAYFSGTVNGAEVVVAGLEGVKGSLWPPIVAGRAPMAESEVLVGSATLDQLGIEIGDSITIDLVISGFATPFTTSATPSLEVVGSAVSPTIGQPGADTPKLGAGILAATSGLRVPAGASGSSVLLFDLAEGTDPEDLMRRFPEGLPVDRDTPTDWFTSATPAEVSQAGSARRVIWLGVGALAVALVCTVLYTLLESVRQRHREYAVLRSIGFTRSQVRTAVLCQSGALIVVALLVAVPVGVAAGRWLWTGFADRVGIVPDPVVPVLLLAASLLSTLALAQVAALVPASLARRAPLAQTLRSE